MNGNMKDYKDNLNKKIKNFVKLYMIKIKR